MPQIAFLWTDCIDNYCVFCSTGQICLHVPRREKIVVSLGGATRATFPGTAFRFSNLSAHKQNPNPVGFEFYIRVHLRYHLSATPNPVLTKNL